MSVSDQKGLKNYEFRFVDMSVIHMFFECVALLLTVNNFREEKQ